jgi:hypothetical protein
VCALYILTSRITVILIIPFVPWEIIYKYYGGVFVRARTSKQSPNNGRIYIKFSDKDKSLYPQHYGVKTFSSKSNFAHTHVNSEMCVVTDDKVTQTTRYHCILSPYIAHLRRGLEMWRATAYIFSKSLMRKKEETLQPGGQEWGWKPMPLKELAS